MRLQLKTVPQDLPEYAFSSMNQTIQSGHAFLCMKYFNTERMEITYTYVTVRILSSPIKHIVSSCYRIFFTANEPLTASRAESTTDQNDDVSGV
jgi:hypothetical protein